MVYGLWTRSHETCGFMQAKQTSINSVLVERSTKSKNCFIAFIPNAIKEISCWKKANNDLDGDRNDSAMFRFILVSYCIRFHLNQKHIPCDATISSTHKFKVSFINFLLVRLIWPHLIPWPQTQTTEIMCSSCAQALAREQNTQQRSNKTCTVITASISEWRKKHSNYAKLQRIFIANFTKGASLQ